MQFKPKGSSWALVHVKKESIRKLSNFNFQWTKSLYQNNFTAYCILFHIFEGL